MFVRGNAIHRDLKPENILINSYGRAVLSDVGGAKILASKADFIQSLSSEVGTPDWMAPELASLLQRNHAESKMIDFSKVDVFSLGLITLFCLDKKKFVTLKQLNLDEKLLHDYLETFRDKIPIPFYYILRCMLSFNSKTRPSMIQLYNDIMHLFPEEKVY